MRGRAGSRLYAPEGYAIVYVRWSGGVGSKKILEHTVPGASCQGKPGVLKLELCGLRDKSAQEASPCFLEVI